MQARISWAESIWLLLSKATRSCDPTPSDFSAFANWLVWRFISAKLMARRPAVTRAVCRDCSLLH